MKKIFALVAALILLAGCDDGEMSFRTFNFNDDTPERCGTESTTYFKRNGSEVLLFELTNANLANVPTATGTPRIISVDLTYRNYDADVTTATFCADIPPASPSVIEEWQGEGQLAIITTAILEEENQGEPGDVNHVTGYSHQLTLITATFAKDGEEITISNVNLGSITRNLGFDFDFESDPATPTVLDSCENNPNTQFIANGTEALVLTLEDDIINAQTDTIINLAAPENNSLVLRVFGSSPGDTSICGPTPPITPLETQRWTAETGTIEITVVQDNGSYIHTVHLKNVKFGDDTSDAVYEVLPADDYIIGTFTTTP